MDPLPRIAPESPTMARRLFLTQVALVAAMTFTVVVVAAVVAPPVFLEHLRRAGHAGQPQVLLHAQEALLYAGLTALGVGVVVAGLGALALSGGLTRRITRGLDALSRGAERVAAGHYDEPVAMPVATRELDAVAGAFNTMAVEIASTEARRRRLLMDVAHELRTPIAAIEVTLEGWQEGVVEPDEDTLAVLRGQSRRLARLADDIRDVTAAEEGRLSFHRESTSTGALVAAAIAAAAPRASDGGVRLRTLGADRRLLADPGRIVQVLDNLLANALRHTPPGGTVTVTTGGDDRAVRITVADTGEGIDAADLPHVMERFYRTDAARSRRDDRGSGVGLSISRAIALAHDGDLTVTSAGLGHGATVTLTLPAAPKD